MKSTTSCATSLIAFIRIALVFLISLVPFAVYAASSPASWMESQAQTDGSYTASADIANAFQSTAEALRTLVLLGQSSQPSIPAAAQYIGAEAYHSTENLSREIIAGADTGGDTSAYLSELTGIQGLNGGFGELAGYEPTPLDTAFALDALAHVGANTSTVQAAISYLLGSQQGDGGWTMGVNTSNVYVTSIVAQALAEYHTKYASIGPALTSAQAYLLAQRNASNLWDSDLDSAEAILALSLFTSDLSVVTDSATALKAKQLTDGSWDDDVMVTAVAARALYYYDALSNGTSNTSGGSVSGYAVTADSGAPIQGANVSVMGISGVAAVTGSDGHFVLTGIPSGIQTVTITKTGYTGSSKSIQVVSGTVTDAGNFVLALSGSTGVVQGYIDDAQSQAALAGVTVTLAGTTNYSVNTDASGNYEILGIAPGDYGVTIQKSGYSTVTGSLTVTAGQSVRLDQALLLAGAYLDSSPGTISGSIVDAKSGSPIAGASFVLSGGQSATSDSNGNFSIASVARGSYTATLSATGYTTQTYSIMFAPGANGALGQLALYPSTGISAPTTLTLDGTVVDGVTQTPIGGAVVTMTADNSQITAGSDGRFTLSGITATTVQLSIAAPGYTTENYTLTVSGFGDAAETFQLPPVSNTPAATSSTVSGKVTDSQTGTAVAGATVTIGSLPAVTSDANGAYQVSGITQNSFTVNASAVGYSAKSVSAQVAAYGNYTLNLALTPVSTANSTFQVLSVAPVQGQAGAGSDLTFDVQIGNLLTTAQDALVIAEVFNSQGVSVGTTTPYAPGTTVRQSAFSFAPQETKTLRLAWDTAQNPPDTYRVVVRAVKPDSISPQLTTGVVLATGDAYGTVSNTQSFSGALGLNPPLTQAGSNTPVTLSALVLNTGNVALTQQAFTLTITGPTGQALYTTSATVDDLAPGSHATVDFGQWIPSANGNLQVSIAAASPVSGTITGNLYVGDKATGQFVVDKSFVPEGTQQVHGTISMQGVDVKTATSTDPLFFAVKQAVQDGGQYVGVQGSDWQRRNSCLGCHIQTQSLVGMASAEGKAPIDQMQTNYFFNAIMTGQQSDGGIRSSSWGFQKTQGALGLWSLAAWPDKAATFRTELKAAEFMYSSRSVSGNQVWWSPDHASGWWRSNDAQTMTVLKGYVDLLQSAQKLDVSSVKDYKLGGGWRLDSSVAYPRSIKSGSDGIYGVSENGKLFRFHPDTGQTDIIASDLPQPSYALAIGSSGEFYIGANGKLIRRNADGTYKTLLTTSGPVTDIEIGSDGALYAADYSGNRILKIDSSGQAQVLASGGLLQHPYGLAFDSSGNIFIANNGGHDILKLTSDGQLTVFADGLSYPPEEISANPAGGFDITTGSNNNVYGWYTVGGVSHVTANGTVERLFQGATYYGIANTGSGLYVANRDTGTIYPIEAVPLDTSALGELQSAVTGTVNFYLSRYNDGSTDNLVQATRLIGLGEADKVITDTTLKSQIESAMTDIAGVLRARQQSDGGWGWYPGYTSDPMVTALVGLALDYTNPSADDPMIRSSIEYLLNHQNSDYSWSSYDGILSTRLASTSLVMDYLPQALDRLGGIDVGLHLVLPSNVTLSNPSIAPTSSTATADGGVDYFWKLLGVTSTSRNVDFDLSLQNMALHEVRSVASATYMQFANSFTNEQMQVNLDIPTVEARSELGLKVSTDKASYDANQPVAISANVVNVGPTAASGDTVDLFIRPKGQTQPIATLTPITVGAVDAGATVPATSQWSTGNTLAGDYEVYGQLYDSTGRLLDEATAPITIAHPGPVLTSAIHTDKQTYQAWDTVQVAAQVTNISGNTVYPATLEKITVTDPDGAVLTTLSDSVGELSPTALRDLDHSFALSDAKAGTYTVALEVFDAFSHTLVSTANTSFAVQRLPMQALAGTVAVQLPRLYIGDTNVCTENLTNRGAAALSGVTVTHTLISLDNGTTVSQSSHSADLAGGATDSLAQSITTDGLPAGGYACVLTATLGGSTQTLAHGSFNLMKPPIRIDSTIGLGGHGRLLVLLDADKHHDDGHDRAHGDDDGDQHSAQTTPQCSVHTVVDLRHVYGQSVGAGAKASVELLDGSGLLLDSESARFPAADGVIDRNTGTQGLDLAIAQLTGNTLDIRVSGTVGAQGCVAASAQVRVSLWQNGDLLPVAANDETTQGGLLVRPVQIDAGSADADDQTAGQPSLDAQRAYLEAALKAAGWNYTLVTDGDAFARELRSGSYMAYALFSAKVKLDEQVQKELREAVYHGAGLLVAGSHDERNNLLDDELGIRIDGKQHTYNGIAFTDSPLNLSGQQNFTAGKRVLTIRRLGASVVANYFPAPAATGTTCPAKAQGGDSHDHSQSGHCTCNSGKDGDNSDKDESAAHADDLVAVTYYAYGQGHSVFAGFDLLAQATAAGGNTLFDQLLTGALGYIQPQPMPLDAGTVVPVDIDLTNQGIAVNTRVVATPPAGSSVFQADNATIDGTGTATWDFYLDVQAQQNLTLWLRLPSTPGDIEVNALIQTLAKDGSYTDYGTLNLPLTVTGNTLAQAKAAADALAQDRHYRDIAKDVDRAAADLAAGRTAKALRTLVEVSDDLIRINDLQSGVLRLQVDAAIHDVAYQWWKAQP